MATVSLGATKVAPTVLTMDALGKVAVKLGYASLYLDPAEADQVALELQRAAMALRINASNAQQYTDALSGKDAA
ncbi:hypothetical protein [Stenotrophomonas sp. B1-1]|uniref:hypothetical protein n=1 Tax=Stenotrophomonas sp. B1-1 TaxID=2710648 RepID=UPI0013DD5B2D|nr:hypothetical protein [Stenotrophomonas sp. B1-1]